jgi:serine phosphatase RsbU (regulator of sigma subunit)
VLFIPKDIVSGDFYWISKPIQENSMLKNVEEQASNYLDETNNSHVLFAACDCTGHGVPGAMVSVVCSNAMNRVVKEFGYKEPAKILDKVAELVSEDLGKNNEDNDEVKDGMDASLASLNTSTGELNWSGANNAIWIVKKSYPNILEQETEAMKLLIQNESFSLFEIKPNKQPIGKTENIKPFNNHTLQLLHGDTIYLFTDGYADQFGGELGKKFSKKRLRELILSMQNLPMNLQGQALKDAHINWRGSNEQVDDICIIGVRV